MVNPTDCEHGHGPEQSTLDLNTEVEHNYKLSYKRCFFWLSLQSRHLSILPLFSAT